LGKFYDLWIKNERTSHKISNICHLSNSRNFAILFPMYSHWAWMQRMGKLETVLNEFRFTGKMRGLCAADQKMGAQLRYLAGWKTS
jgi:hypothetical protein